MKLFEAKTPLPLFYVGPDITQGPLPAIFYFALSAEESLLTDPFNQPLSFWASLPVRIFSVDLPYHGKGFSSTEAMHAWSKAMEQEDLFLERFIADLIQTASHLFSTPAVDKERIATAGLSRGGFIASHLATGFPEIATLLAFAPMTLLESIKEFPSSSPFIERTALSHLQDRLAHKKIKIYMGNRDTRVGTDPCYHWFRSLVESAYAQKIRSPLIELVIKPSIGYLGHGTAKETFQEGANWLIEQLSL